MILMIMEIQMLQIVQTHLNQFVPNVLMDMKLIEKELVVLQLLKIILEPIQ